MHGFTLVELSVGAIPDKCALYKRAVIHGNFLRYYSKTYIALLFNDINFFKIAFSKIPLL